MKGKFTLSILEKLSEAAVGALDLFEAFLESGYGASRSKIEYNMRVAKGRRSAASSYRLEYLRIQRRYHNIIAWLKRDGLIKEHRKDGKATLGLTQKGVLKLLFLRKRRDGLPSVNSYDATESSNFVIVAFDIQEKERRKREWLRGVLKNMGFKMLQKSVWIGKVKIPEGFLSDISRLQLVDFVEIFEITKTGSLRHLA